MEPFDQILFKYYNKLEEFSTQLGQNPKEKIRFSELKFHRNINDILLNSDPKIQINTKEEIIGED